MLVQFSMKNFLSFQGEVTLDLTAVDAYQEHAYKLLDTGTKEKLVRVAAIYGANASGKTNLYLGLSLFKRIVKESANNVDEEQEKAVFRYYFPYAYEKKQQDTEFQLIQLIDGFEYKYGFSYHEKGITAEWMYRRDLESGRMTTLLEREGDNVLLGTALQEECEPFRKQISKETLALSFFHMLKLQTDIFRQVYRGITGILTANTDSFEKEPILRKRLPVVIDTDKDGLMRFLNAIDVGIQDIGYEPDEKKKYFWTKHSHHGKLYEEDLFNESQGTLKSIAIYSYVKEVIARDRVMFVDELNTKLHPLLLKFIVDLFYAEDTKAQLIYTTHDTALMDKKFFRRDQIWFVQKDAEGCSELTSLSDYKVRSEDSYEKDYLAGVYGGIPMLEPFSWKEGDSTGKR